MLATCRFDAGLTQTELAKRLGIPAHTVISQYEAGIRRFPVEKLVKLAAATNTQPLPLIKVWLETYAADVASVLFSSTHDSTGKDILPLLLFPY